MEIGEDIIMPFLQEATDDGTAQFHNLPHTIKINILRKINVFYDTHQNTMKSISLVQCHTFAKTFPKYNLNQTEDENYVSMIDALLTQKKININNSNSIPELKETVIDDDSFRDLQSDFYKFYPNMKKHEDLIDRFYDQFPKKSNKKREITWLVSALMITHDKYDIIVDVKKCFKQPIITSIYTEILYRQLQYPIPPVIKAFIEKRTVACTRTKEKMKRTSQETKNKLTTFLEKKK